ncbi:tyrosine-type recombinase/integrase [Rhodococcus erythropolis]|uniref:tyrosine-type recombinase/integrase n=1 Tax=Rhodococcus erythropolis TaxID=1833 RepID=UPI003D0EA450
MAPRRNRRAGVEDLWWKTVRVDGKDAKVETKLHGKGKRWRARYVDDRSSEHTKRFDRKVDAQNWLNTATSALLQGTHVAPRDAKLTVQQWCDLWIEGYAVNRKSTVKQARTHIARITAEFGTAELSAIRPSQVKAWCARMRADGRADSYVYAIHSRLSHILSDAVHDGVLGRNPCSRRTAPPMGKPKVYVATTGQVWALHDAMPDFLQVAVLLGAFAGLRIGEVSGLRVTDVDFPRGIITPAVQFPDEPLKTDVSKTPIPIPAELTFMLAESVRQWPGERLVTDGFGGHAAPWTIERLFRDAKESVGGLPDEFTFHDFRHYFASVLIASGASVKTVQARVRHSSAKTTLDTYGHMWPDADESTRSAISAVIASRADSLEEAAYSQRTEATD